MLDSPFVGLVCNDASARVPIVNKPRKPILTADELLSRDDVRSLIRRKARSLCRSSGFTPSDREDLEQDLALQVFQKAAQYKPDRASPQTYASRVLDTAAATIIRHKRRRKRAHMRPLRSLAEPVNDEVSTSLASSISTDDRGRHLQLDIASDQDQLIMREAAAHAIATCDEQLQTLAANLERGTVASVAREMGLSRHKRRALLETSRPAFKKAGFGNSLK